IVVLAVLYWRDRLQREHAIRHNYPLIGRLRYWFEDLGTFFRQYFFALDREEMPFNRAERAWVYRSAKNLDATIAFGSSMNISRPGQILFANGAFPSLHEDFSAPG